MTNHVSLLFCFMSSITVLAMALSGSAATEEKREVYIVYMGALPEDGVYSPSSHHLNILQQVTGTSSVETLLVRSYKRSFNGFAAKLTKEEKQKLASMEEVVSVFPDRILKPQTTRSWDFMGFSEIADRKLSVESDIVVGVLDTGLWPESDSFKDDGFGPPPKKWKGECKGGANFTCNNKVIGARSYKSESARDDVGHGSHIASTAAGRKVTDASFYGIANGTARGGVPSARIAVYRVCGQLFCPGSAIMAAFDDAIADGVDIISISIGNLYPERLETDVISIGAFHAMEKGILTSQAAGNSGPDRGRVISVSPWILSVAASTFDRKIATTVALGDGRKFVDNYAQKTYNTESLSTVSILTLLINGTNVPLVYGKQASNSCSETAAGVCQNRCLDESLVKGKVVLCDNYAGVTEAYRAGAVVITIPYTPDTSFVVPLPTSALNENDYASVKSYFNSAKGPVAMIMKGEGIKVSGAPIVASFSGRGPNSILPDILKPDVIAPGVEVVAAYSLLVSPSNYPSDERRVKYNIISGTSMSCPHAAGLAAYVKSFHPDWSSSAIKSAIMTTAWPINGTELEHGSGHINPVKAINPGLVYDSGTEDYIQLLCGAGYSDDQVRKIIGGNTTCKHGSDEMSPKDMNYPSMAAKVPLSTTFNVTFTRTVTNVGLANSTYKAEVSMTSEVTVKVVPEVLTFTSLNEKKTFVVSFSGQGIPEKSMVSASLTWSDGTHLVRSPIVAHA